MIAGAGNRTILDISSIARWTGPAVGILRVEQALARYAMAQRPDIVLAVYDKAAEAYFTINACWIQHLVSWQGGVSRRRGTLRSLLPSPYSAVRVLEGLRTACRVGAIANQIRRAQELIIAASRSRRRGFVPFRVVIGPQLAVDSRDLILSVGTDWTHKDAAGIAALKKQFGFRHVVMCHDIIPLLFPQYFTPDVASAFRGYWNLMFPLADKILVNSHRVRSDLQNYCHSNSISLSETTLVRLGCDMSAGEEKTPLPSSLDAGRYILFVGTIEPRKGHEMLMRVWQKLLDAGAPQSQNFKLVFVGRRGWGVDAVLDQIGDGARFGGTLVHLVAIADEQLHGLYRAAAFCVYPSLYEGFGLPIIEAFSHGKAVIASTGGALPEIVGGLSPCLEPTDENAWFETLRTWIEQPKIRQQYETRIYADFSWPTWDRAAAEIFNAAESRVSARV